jgi:hypothetical protein
MNTATDFFDLLDKEIDRLLNVSDAENALFDLFSGFTHKLKERAGTSAGISGLSEYVFFQFVKRSFENKLGIEFQRKDLKNRGIFRSDEFLLTHDTDISKFVEVAKQRPDIAVFSVPEEGRYKLLAAFELKIYVTGPDVVADMIKKFENLAEKTTVLLFMVLFQNGYGRHLDSFCPRYPERAFVISKTNLNCRISLNEAIDRIVASAR